VYCTAATVCQPNCIWQIYLIIFITSYIMLYIICNVMSYHVISYRIIYHITYFIYYNSNIIFHTSYFIYRTSYIIHHISYNINHIISYFISYRIWYISYRIIYHIINIYNSIWTVWTWNSGLLIRYMFSFEVYVFCFPTFIRRIVHSCHMCLNGRRQIFILAKGSLHRNSNNI